MQMQFFAFGAKCGGLSASGEASSGAAISRPSSRKSDANAKRPIPEALVARKSRRQQSQDSDISLLASDAFIQVQKHPGYRHPCTIFTRSEERRVGKEWSI